MEIAAAAVDPPIGESGVRGRIEVVTERPIVLPREGSPRARAEELINRRPWLVPTLLVGVIAMLLARERHHD